ncbi:hypothetical protein VTN77DRAFT_2853 [Rasamsonia byssochlamydoides]|uniref:uncharacterized protein n=1 Tax=Rasamsonia byssochlamydoides TaxID=89139 RepID=UPI003742E81E
MSLDRGGGAGNNQDQSHGASSTTTTSSPLKDLESGVSGTDGFVDLSRHSSESLDSAQSDSVELPDYANPDEGLLGHGDTSRATPSWASKGRRRRRGCLWSCIARLQSWIRGPQSPRKYRIEPFFPRFQTAPIRLVDRFLPTRSSRVWALVAFHALWALIFLTILHRSVTGLDIPGYGKPVRLSCGSRLWSNSTNCGLNGDECRPFDDASFAFRCPAGCRLNTLLEPYTVGDQDYNYQLLVIGGASDAGDDTTGIYRGDSFLCASAIHAGVINGHTGGCGILRRTGEKSHYASVEKNGITSIPFSSNFPLSFTFDREVASSGDCRDPRWLLLTISVFFTALLSLFTTSPAVFYGSVFFITYFQVALASDPPFSSDYDEVVSICLGRFLPAAFVGFAIYYFCVRRTLTDLTAQWEKTILWLGACWVGALNTDTFDRIPISRLTPHDIQQQPGAVPALIIIITILVIALLSQAWALRIEGRLPQYLLLYGIMACGLLAMLAVPQLNLRIHHYILGLLFLPGTALQTRPSLLYQGLLVGLFINGIARWGFDSILQTPAALLEDAQLGSLLPNIAVPVIKGENITFSFPILPDDVAGISVLVNDVERFRAYRYSDAEGDSQGGSQGDGAEPFHWSRLREGEPEYFRFGYFKRKALGGIWYEDFTKAGTWRADGSWVHMAPGASR